MENENLIIDSKDGNTWVADILDETYSSRISETLDYPKNYLDAMQKNYPDMTKEEIIEEIESQKDYDIYFHHQHEWISWDLIKKYLILENVGTEAEKITLETDEIHDCNLVELTPELQEKSYWWYRWNRTITSHLIDKDDYPTENKTNKLTIIWKLIYPDFDDYDDYDDYEIGYDYDSDENTEKENIEDGNESEENENIEGEDMEEEIKPYFYVITAFWWDWSSCSEPKSFGYWYDFQQMEYWMNHALIPETNEHIERRDRPFRVDEYHKMVEEKKNSELRCFSVREMYRQLINCIKSESGEFNQIEDLTMWKCFDMNDEEISIDTKNWPRFNKIYFMLHDWNKFRVIEAGIPYIMLNKDEYEDDGTPQIVLNKDMTESDILDIDFTKNFKINVIKDVDNGKEIEDEDLVKYRKNFIKRYYKEENFGKIINAVDLIDCKRETDSEWSKITTIRIWNTVFKLMESNLSNHSDDKYESIVRSCYENISDFRRCGVQLDWIRWDNPDKWENKEIAEYVKRKESEWFKIPGDEFTQFLSELWKVSGIERTEDQLLLLMYLTWMDGDYWLSMNWDYRRKLRLEIPMMRSNIGNVSAKLFFMSCTEMK